MGTVETEGSPSKELTVATEDPAIEEEEMSPIEQILINSSFVPPTTSSTEESAFLPDTFKKMLSSISLISWLLAVYFFIHILSKKIPTECES